MLIQQHSHLQKHEWDDVLPLAMQTAWVKLAQDLKSVLKVELERRFHSSTSTSNTDNVLHVLLMLANQRTVQ